MVTGRRPVALPQRFPPRTSRPSRMRRSRRPARSTPHSSGSAVPTSWRKRCVRPVVATDRRR